MVINSHVVEAVTLLSVASIVWSAAFAWTRWLVRPRDSVATSPEYLEYLAARVAKVEQASSEMSRDLERLAEGQRFTARLLAERLPPADVKPRATGEPRRVDTPH